MIQTQAGQQRVKDHGLSRSWTACSSHSCHLKTSISLCNVQMKMKIKHLTSEIKMVNKLNKWPQLLVALFLSSQWLPWGRRLTDTPPPISPLLSLTLWRTAREALQSHPGHHYYPKQPRIYVSVLERNKYSASGDIRHFKSLPRETLCSVRVVPWNKVNTETQPVTQTGGHYTK